MPRHKPKATKSGAGGAAYAPTPAPAHRAEILTPFHYRCDPSLGADGPSDCQAFALDGSLADALACARQVALAGKDGPDVWLVATDDPTAEALDEASLRQLLKPRRGKLPKHIRPGETPPIYVHSKARDVPEPVVGAKPSWMDRYTRNLEAWGQLPVPRAPKAPSPPAPSPPLLVPQPPAEQSHVGRPVTPIPTPSPAPATSMPKQPRGSVGADEPPSKRPRLGLFTRRDPMPAPSPAPRQSATPAALSPSIAGPSKSRTPSKSQTPAPVPAPSNMALPRRNAAVIDIGSDSDDEVVVRPKSALPTPAPDSGRGAAERQRSESQPRRPNAPQPTARAVTTISDDDDSDIEVVQQIVRGGQTGVASSPARTPSVADAASWGVRARTIDGGVGAALDVHEWMLDSKRASGTLGDLVVFPLSKDGVVTTGPPTRGQVVVILDQLVVHAIRSRSTSKPTFELAVAEASQPPNFSSCLYLGRYEMAFDRTLSWDEYEKLPRPQRRDLVRGLTSSEQWEHFAHLPSVARVPTTAAARGKTGLKWLRTAWGATPPLEPNGYVHACDKVQFNDLRFRHATQDGAEQAIRDGYVDGLGFVVARCVGHDRAALDAALETDRDSLAAMLGDAISPQRQKLRPGQLSARLQSSLQQRPS